MRTTLLLHLILAADLCFPCNAFGNVCELPAIQGPCDQVLVRWHYNSGTEQCEKFVYGGCEGNGNNFLTKEQCEATCNPSSKNEQSGFLVASRPEEASFSQCHLPMDQGPCKQVLFRWHYNKATRQCEKFIYGGCLGNENNFLTKEMCEAKCRSLPPPKPMPLPNLPCDDYPRVWFFQPEKRKCKLDCHLCAQYPRLCYRSKLECVQNRSPKDVVCLSLSEGFHILNPKHKCSKYYFSCLDGVFTNHTCSDEYRFDVLTNVCRPLQFVKACQPWPYTYT
uniref:Tissue factor pathway inhibitor n=1 Tax=Trichuris muris TaxID=70415 RepID=A0A5S6Q1H1_TRIMR